MKFTRHSDTSATFESADGRRFGSVSGTKESVDAFYANEMAREQGMPVNAAPPADGLPLPTMGFGSTDNGPQTAAGGHPGALARNAGLHGANAATGQQGGEGLPLPCWDNVPTRNAAASVGLPLPSWDD